MWDKYEGMSWSERLVNGGAVILGGATSFLFFCLSNLRVIAISLVASVWISAYWTLTHPKPPVLSAPAPFTAPVQPPAATVLYPPNYTGPDMYGVPQNK